MKSMEIKMKKSVNNIYNENIDLVILQDFANLYIASAHTKTSVDILVNGRYHLTQ